MRAIETQRAKRSGFASEALGPPPASLGYAMPAEWGLHEATWIAWPHFRGDWPGKFEPIPWVYAEILRLLARGERVHIFVQPSSGGRFAKEVMAILERNHVNVAHVTLHTQPTDRVWTRDSGPIFVQRKRKTQNAKPKTRSAKVETAVVDFKFNAWARYENSALDDRLPAAVAEYLDVPRFVAYGENDAGSGAEGGEFQRFVLEGGSIDVNGGAVGGGGGCLLTTEECLLSKVQQRNPGFSRGRIERVLCDYLGVRKILWLGRGIAGDDTHGHVDDTARFVNESTIVACVETDKGDVNYGPTRENLRRLGKMRDAGRGGGKPFTIVELPMPEGVYFEGKRLPASYANFYIANVGVLVPVFNDPNDSRALQILEACFKDRAVIPVYCRDLVLGRGTLHCITQQQPAME